MKQYLTTEEKFVIFWLYTRVAEKIPQNPINGGSNDITVNGINVTNIVKNLLQDRLFV